MRKTRTDPEVRRQQILEAATHMIGLQGYNGLTVHDLARKCGLTNGGLLYYFGSKEQLLIAILEERDRNTAAIIHADLEIERAKSGQADFTRRTVVHTFRAIITRCVAQPEFLRFHIVLKAEALNPEHPAHGFFLRREEFVLSEFAKLLTGHVDNPERRALQIFALLEGIQHQWLRTDMAFDLLAEFGAAIELVLPWAAEFLKSDEIYATA